MEKESKIFIFETGIKDGVFSENKKFYPSYFTKNDIRKQFLQTKKKISEKYNFNDKKIFQAYQKTENNKLDYENGKYIVITDDLIKEDCWYNLIPTDIFILSKKVKDVVLGNQMADCPILIVEDREKEVTALSHCGASYINRMLPVDTVKALIKEFNSNIDDLYVYVGSCAKKENYIYDKYPFWATDEKVWKGLATYTGIQEDKSRIFMIQRGVDDINKGDFRSFPIHQCAKRVKQATDYQMLFDPSHSYGPKLRAKIVEGTIEAMKIKLDNGDWLYDGILLEVGTSTTDTEQHIAINELSNIIDEISKFREI